MLIRVPLEYYSYAQGLSLILLASCRKKSRPIDTDVILLYVDAVPRSVTEQPNCPSTAMPVVAVVAMCR